jgi:hypothetical protein
VRNGRGWSGWCERTPRGRPWCCAHGARIILAAADGLNNAQIERALGCDVETASIWRRRWLEARQVPLAEVGVAERLADAPRPGAVPRITAEQVGQIIALACEQPDASGRPISQWRHREWAAEIVQRGITERISPRHAGRVLQGCRSQAASDPVLGDTGHDRARRAARRAERRRVGGLSAGPGASGTRGTDTEHRRDDQRAGTGAGGARSPWAAGQGGAAGVRVRPPRHALVPDQLRRGQWPVASGQVVAPSCGATRTEADCAAHVQQTVASDPTAGRWHSVVDTLNTHCSETRVRYVAQVEGLTDELGEKGRHGVLHTMQTRAAFLSNPAHRLVFHYTPKHASWLNQVEIWRGILVRKVLRRGSFASVEALQTRVLAFIQ